MALKYISDDKGKTTAVLIPIRDWNLLKKKYKLPEEGEVSLTLEQKKELNSRVDNFLKNPDNLLEWGDVKQKLLSKKNEV